MKSYFIITDLEGVAGVDSFTQTRPGDGHPERIDAARTLLAREVNACVEGIRSVEPDARIDVWDGHGPGGLFAEHLRDCHYLREGRPYMNVSGYDAVLFVGQHAMAGTFNAPLCHTYSSMTVAYFKLNGTFVGEFGARALIAGLQGVPVVFLSGDDKAALEARLFIPEIETAVVKLGLGVERAEHLSEPEAHRLIREGAARAVRRAGEVPPFRGMTAPFRLEIGYLAPLAEDELPVPGAERINDYTIRITKENIVDLPI